MRTLKQKQSGFAIFEALIIVVVVAALAGVSYVVIKHTKKTTVPTASQQTKTAQVPAAPAIQTADDLSKASTTLDQTNLDAGLTDTTQLDQMLNAL